MIEHAFEAGGGTIPAHALCSVEPIAAAGALGIALGDTLRELGAYSFAMLRTDTGRIAVDDMCAVTRLNKSVC